MIGLQRMDWMLALSGRQEYEKGWQKMEAIEAILTRRSTRRYSGEMQGSTALLDKNSGMLFSGDPIQDGHIFMFGEMRDLSAYIHSLRRLDKYKDDIKGIYANHGTLPVDYSIVPKLIEGALQVERGEIVPVEVDRFGKTVHVYDVGVASVLCD
ncbi:hypothetical protein SAMN04487884_14419 [Butyrivibrio fibrisolvens]|uniref:Uncharacterized protein n=1 Tax=Butyrivibrio fibrisolvens TaxID=831 RepID=A0A1H9X5W6_BUTFI|nr:hypothetical protein [Butyrivibrio fibrisolvens]SES41441.1 hypothetical protein SAMN04487884_14419 [Butyrivibrio fibrisolvens]